MSVGSVWFGSGKNVFQGGIAAAGNHTMDFLEQKTENGENIVFLPSFPKPFLTWVLVDGCIEIQEAYAELMLHAEDDIYVRFGPDGETCIVEKGQVVCVCEQNYRRKDNENHENDYDRCGRSPQWCDSFLTKKGSH